MKRRRLGGGSQCDFLNPMHRIDQPCSGALLLAKNSKAAKRVARAWKLGQVQKEYICVVESNSVDEIIKHSYRRSADSDALSDGSDQFGVETSVWGDCEMWADRISYSMTGVIQKRGTSSVIVTPLERPNADRPPATGDEVRGRVCHIEWCHLTKLPIKSDGQKRTVNQRLQQNGNFELLLVRTNSGARHQVRALLSAVGSCPVAGDVRYGSFHGPLPDKSVALHARRLYLPTVTLGGTDLSEPFVAPIPAIWLSYFGLTEEVLLQLEQGSLARVQ